MKTIKNIFKNKELRFKILLTLSLLIIFKIGTIVKIPTIGNISTMENNSILLLMNYISGSYLGKFTIFSLGITPYITASIAIQLLGMGVIPGLERWKNEGESGRKKTEKLTFIVSCFLALIESVLLTYVFQAQYKVLADSNLIGFVLTSGTLFIGSIIVLLIARIITRKGIGNGSSLIVFMGIVSRLGYDIYWTAKDIIKGSNLFPTISLFVIYLLFFILVIALVVFIDKSVRKIKIEYTKQSREFSNNQSSIPLKVNLSSVIPIIFTVSILTGFAYLGTFTNIKIFNIISDYQNIYGYLIYVFLIIFFAMYYTKELYNPKTISENTRKSNAVIQGKLPGIQTEKYLNEVITHMALFSGISLVIIASLPILISVITKTSFNLALGGTSVMILAGVAIETMSEIRAKVKTIKSEKLSLFD